MQHASLILSNNKTKSKNFNSFIEENIFFYNTQVSLPICHIFIKKICVVSKVNVAAVFTQHSKLFT